MNTTGKLIFALVIAVNLTAIAAVSSMNPHRRAAPQTRVVHLQKIVVTPANAPWKSPTGDAEAQVIKLGTVVVTPTEADWRFAEAHGVYRSRGVATAAVNTDDTGDQTAADPVLHALAALSPGQYLDAGAALRALNTLVFDGRGR